MSGKHPLIGKQVSGPDGKVGILTDVMGTTAYLRPERGGRGWPVPLGDVEPVTEKAQDREAMSVKVAEANRRSRGEL
ncbi:hypothetical protein [Streptomyces sp. T028]|uniref:hypothetical protein n=1 Tax=Streptomyces sp. T028 TaxID=3394379 RepID=UPI003A8B3259